MSRFPRLPAAGAPRADWERFGRQLSDYVLWLADGQPKTTEDYYARGQRPLGLDHGPTPIGDPSLLDSAGDPRATHTLSR